MSACATCGVTLGRTNKTGYCRAHFGATLKGNEELRQRRADGLRRKIASDPVYAAKLRQQAIALARNEAIKERRLSGLRRGEWWKLGQAAIAADPSIRQRSNKTQSDNRLAWCPNHLREDYKALIRAKYGRDEARRIILEQDAKERHRLRVKMGVAEPDSDWTPEAYGPPCPEHLRPLMAASKAFKVSLGDLLSSDRHKPLVRARQAVMLALRKQGLSFPKIAPILNLKDHSTVIYGVRQAEYLAANDAGFARALARVVAA